MRKIRKRLSYANVMSTLAVFLLVAGGTAVAAKQLGKKTVGAKQLKTNAVTTAKIKKAAVTKAKIKNGAIDNSKLADNAVTGAKVADGSVTGADINASSTAFSQITTRLRNSNTVPVTNSLTAHALGSYTQNAGSDDQYLGGVDIAIPASCIQPRTVQGLLLLDAANPSVPTSQDIVGLGILQDSGAGAVSRRIEFGTGVGGSPMARMAPPAATPHTFTLLVIGICGGGGSGITASGAAVDVISTK